MMLNCIAAMTFQRIEEYFWEDILKEDVHRSNQNLGFQFTQCTYRSFNWDSFVTSFPLASFSFSSIIIVIIGIGDSICISSNSL